MVIFQTSTSLFSMSKLSLPPSAVSIQQRFHVWHGAALHSAAHLKIAKYLAGLEVAALAEACEAAPGRKSGDAAPTFETVVEEALNVSARTARRYRAFFEHITTNAPAVADALNTLWRKFSGEGKGKALALPDAEKAGALASGALSAAQLLELCHAADEMGISELFEAPMKDAGGEDGGEDGKGASRKAAKERLLRFWGRDVMAAIERREFLRLPKEVRATLAEQLDAAAKELKATLKGGAK